MIGHFSTITGTSKRMLRHFDKLGILKPTYIDPENGYRYYSDEQIHQIASIKLLQEFGFTLSEIKALLESSISHDYFIDRLKDKEVMLRNEVDKGVSQLLRIRQSIEILTEQPTFDSVVKLNTLKLERTFMNTTNNPSIDAMKAQLFALPSPSMFMEYIEEHTQNPQNETLFFLTFDIDNFAPINENFGYTVGDYLIYKTASLIIEAFSALIKNNAGILSRLGGDEIGIFLHGLEKETVMKQATLALSQINQFDYSQYQYTQPLSCTCGFYHTKQVENVAELRHISTKAMMEAKRLGGNQVYTLDQ